MRADLGKDPRDVSAMFDRVAARYDRTNTVLSVGNAGGLRVTVGDRPGVVLGKSGEVRRNIVITKQSLPSILEEASSVRASHSS